MKLIILFLSILLIITSCGKNCKEEAIAKIYLDQEVDEYFGIYEKGNYWVYENQDKTKRDSIYVTESKRDFVLYKTQCENIETLEFTLKENSKEIVSTDSVCITGSRNNVNTQNCKSSTFFTGILSIINFYNDTIITDNYKVNRINNITLNGQYYTGGLIQLARTDTLYMQKNVGIIGWKKNNEIYNLVNKYLQP